MGLTDSETGRGDTWWRGLLRLPWRNKGEQRETLLPARWWELATYGGLLLVAAMMRLWDLGSRAMHHDESLHALYAWNLYAGNGYQHDPMMHGPFQIESTAAVFFLFGDSEYTARLLYALAGIALVGLPFLFRARLGRLGALMVSTLLAFSPATLYFSRFARNDILMAVWTLGLVVCMWRYIDEGKHRYLYIGSAILALAFATKETAYIVTATLGLYLFLFVTFQNWAAIRPSITIGQVSPPVAVLRLLEGGWYFLARRLTLVGVSRSAGFLVLLFTLSLPLGAALVSVFQDTPLLSWSNLVLASPIGGSGPIGAPIGGALVVAALVIVVLLWISASVGFRWSRTVWWRCAAIFWGVFVLLYSTFFTNMVGIGSGIWQSLGYWLVQQEVARGGQPLYYYFVISSIYEFLPLVFAIIGGVYYIRRKDSFGQFLVFWAGATFVLYSVASEKMPWLLVNVTLPLIVLSGRFLGDVIKGVRWRDMVSGGGLLALAGVPIFLVLSWRLAFVSMDAAVLSDVLWYGVSLAVLLALSVLGFVGARRMGYGRFAGLAAISLAVVLLALTVRAGWCVSYRNSDTPVEMMVYVQTSPEIVQVLRHIEQGSETTGERTGIPIAIDQKSGFAWPWVWYLRDYTQVGYGSYDAAPLQNIPSSSVVLVHADNQPAVAHLLADRYIEGVRIAHRRWFPEDYKGLTLGKFLGALVDLEAWRNAMGYFLDRDVMKDRLGSEDVYVYFSKEFPAGFPP